LLGLGKKTDREKAGLVSNADLVSYVDEEYERRRKDRQLYELQWQLNVNMIEGHQYCDIDPHRMVVEEVDKMYAWQEREVFNQIAPVVETRIARLTNMKPILKARAPTNSSKDARSARVSSQLLRNLYYEQGISSQMAEVFSWSETTGTCFLKSIWNPNKGPIVGNITVETVNEKTQEPEEEHIEIREGGLSTVVVPPYEIFPDSNFRNDVKDCKSIIHARAIHIDEIKEIWGVKVDAEPATSVKLQKSLAGAGFSGGYNNLFTSTQLQNHAIVKEYWEIPSKKFPEGRHIIVANGKLLHEGKIYCPVGDENELVIPIERVVSIKRPGVFWGRCVVDRLIPVQRRYNALRNRKAEFLNRVAIGQYLVEEGSTDLDDLQENVGQPGYMFVYQRGFNPPQQVRNQQLPTAFDTEEAALLQEINVFSGTSDLSKQSKAPPGVKSGVAMSIALEQDDTRLSATAKNVENFLVNCGKMWLRFHQIFVSGVRILKAIGEDNVVEFLDWTGSDISSDDVYVEPFSAMAESPAQRRQMVFDLLSSGLFHNEEGIIEPSMKSKIFEMIDLGNWESADSEAQLHIAKAERQNIMLSNFQEAPVFPYDDHLLHIERHNKFRLTVEYEEAMMENPMLEEFFQQHVDQHLEFLAPPPGAQPIEEEPPPEGGLSI